mmetsp:Transcript_149150/g.479050  ORF Transcript_149150/g.479050 Transcript_149150/m.479050 type:complete len:231 (-) Transcript_149150:121-813(-)
MAGARGMPTLRGGRRCGAAAGLLLVAAMLCKLAGSVFCATASRRSVRGGRMHLRAEPEEPQGLNPLSKAMGGLIGGKEKSLDEGEQFTTPVEEFMSSLFGGGGKKEKTAEAKRKDGFFDSSDTDNYVTVSLEKPFGLGLAEATEGGGVMVAELQPGSNSENSGEIFPGFQVIAVDGEPVHGLPQATFIQIVGAKASPVKLTFFKGPADSFYGKLAPSTAWLKEFIGGLKS